MLDWEFGQGRMSPSRQVRRSTETAALVFARCSENQVQKRAFEDAWASIAPDWIDNVRISLAHAIVAHGVAGAIDCETLKAAALEVVQ
jgi:hypothetical protein